MSDTSVLGLGDFKFTPPGGSQAVLVTVTEFSPDQQADELERTGINCAGKKKFRPGLESESGNMTVILEKTPANAGGGLSANGVTVKGEIDVTMEDGMRYQGEVMFSSRQRQYTPGNIVQMTGSWRATEGLTITAS